MCGGGKKKTMKNQDTEMISLEKDSAVTGIVDKTDPEVMNKLVDMSEEETEEALRTVLTDDLETDVFDMLQ